NGTFIEDDDQLPTKVQNSNAPNQTIHILDGESQLPSEKCGNSYKLCIADTNTEVSNESDDDKDYSLISMIPQLKSLKKRINKHSEWVRLGIMAVLVLLYISYFFTVIAVHTTIQ
ncbi:unnamed protein product, partial [Meganyctiphanes norvegica]